MSKNHFLNMEEEMDRRPLYGNLMQDPRAGNAFVCGHRPSSSYLRALVERAAHQEPAIEKEALISALEAHPMAELREGRGMIFCDVLDAHAYLEWLADSKPGPNPAQSAFQIVDMMRGSPLRGHLPSSRRFFYEFS